MKLFLLSLVLIALAMAGMAISLLVRKNGKFPDGHIGHNREMKKKGIVCAKTWDRIEQKKGADVSIKTSILLKSQGLKKPMNNNYIDFKLLKPN
jgi:hypothetical protein